MMRTRSHLHIFVRGTCPQGASPTLKEQQQAPILKTPAAQQTPGTTRARRVRAVATSPLQKRPRTAGLEGSPRGAADGAMDTPTARTRKPQTPIKGLFTRTRGSGGGRGRSEAGRPAGAVKVLHKDLGKVVDHLLEIGVRVCVCACVRVCVCACVRVCVCAVSNSRSCSSEDCFNRLGWTSEISAAGWIRTYTYLQLCDSCIQIHTGACHDWANGAYIDSFAAASTNWDTMGQPTAGYII